MYPFLQVHLFSDVIYDIDALLAGSDRVTLALTCKTEVHAYSNDKPVQFARPIFLPVVAARHGYRNWIYWWFTEVWERHIASHWASDRELVAELLHDPCEAVLTAAFQHGHPDIAFMAAAFMNPNEYEWAAIVDAASSRDNFGRITRFNYPPNSLRALLDLSMLDDFPYDLVASFSDATAPRPRHYGPLIHALRAYETWSIINTVMHAFVFDDERRPIDVDEIDLDALECIWEFLGGDHCSPEIMLPWGKPWPSISVLHYIASISPERWKTRHDKIEAYYAARGGAEAGVGRKQHLTQLLMAPTVHEEESDEQ